MLAKLFNVLEDAPVVTTADIVIIVIIVLIVLGIIAYFAYKKMNGKRISDCGCGSTDKKKLQLIKRNSLKATLKNILKKRKKILITVMNVAVVSINKINVLAN